MMTPEAIVRNNSGRAFQNAPMAQAVQKLLLSIWIALLLILLPALAAAHSPQEIVLAYNQTQRMLEVRITHNVSDPAQHFVSSVEIKKDGKTISRHAYRNQPGMKTVVYAYPLDPFPDGMIEVTVTCSVSGSASEKLDMRKIPR